MQIWMKYTNIHCMTKMKMMMIVKVMKSWKRTDWILNASRKFDGDVNEQLVRKQQIPQDLEPCVDQRPIRVST